MEQVITAKLKLNTMPEQHAALRKAQLAYRDALNYVSKWSFDHGKLSNQERLQRECYDEIRSRFNLPSQMLRTLLVRQDWASTGVLSVRPDGSNDEAKAARLHRYAELRWSSDSSPRL